jgi:hypothetical protein
MLPLTRYSKIKAGVPKGTPLKWLFPQERATLQGSIEGTVALVLLKLAMCARRTLTR